MELRINYTPHAKQREVHEDNHRFRIIVAGRRSGKTTLAVNEIIKAAFQFPKGRSWFISPTYRQSKQNVWDDWKGGIFNYLPKEFIDGQPLKNELAIRCKNGHLIELKGAENKDKLRGAGLVFCVFDEYGHMDRDTWEAVVFPMLAQSRGRAVFIGTPSIQGSPHFKEIWDQGQRGDPEYRSWIFYTKDNPYIPPEEIEMARRKLPPRAFKREYEADFSVAEGLIYDNFDYGVHIIPTYEPKEGEYIIGSIDPGLAHETGALLTAWDKEGTCRIFKEYYQKGRLAEENARELVALTKAYKKVDYWIIDRAAIKRDPRSGLTVYDAYREHLRPLVVSPNDAGSVLYGINEVKRLLQPDSTTKQAKLYIGTDCTNFINEIQHYSWYKPRFETKLDAPEKPRKYRDDLMDCIKNIILTKPWLYHGYKPSFKRTPDKSGY